MPDRSFVVVSQDGTGLGWATRLADEGEDVALVLAFAEDDECQDAGEALGDGLVSKLSLEQAQKSERDAYWIFDTNCHSDVSMALRNDGVKVFGAQDIAEALEHDRAFAMSTAQSEGLDVPDSEELTTAEEGVAFLEAHADRSWVFKPNDADASHLTFVPNHADDADANAELIAYLSNLADPVGSGFVLQERKHGIEACFEVWLSQGVPILATCTLENKRQLNGDLGENGPCAHDLIWLLDPDALGIQETAMKLARALPTDYTGSVDVNVIAEKNKLWFLETGCRFGYNAHPNLFLSLAVDTFGNIMADWIDGASESFAPRFRSEFGASISVRLDHPRPGLPVQIADDAAPAYYPYDLMMKDGQLLTTGYSHDLGIYCHAGATIKAAGRACLADLLAQAISVPDIGFRTDIARDDYDNAPIRRYEALHAFKLI